MKNCFAGKFSRKGVKAQRSKDSEGQRAKGQSSIDFYIVKTEESSQSF